MMQLTGDSTYKRYCDACNLDISSLRQWTDRLCPFCKKRGDLKSDKKKFL